MKFHGLYPLIPTEYIQWWLNSSWNGFCAINSRLCFVESILYFVLTCSRVLSEIIKYFFRKFSRIITDLVQGKLLNLFKDSCRIHQKYSAESFQAIPWKNSNSVQRLFLILSKHSCRIRLRKRVGLIYRNNMYLRCVFLLIHSSQ